MKSAHEKNKDERKQTQRIRFAYADFEKNGCASIHPDCQVYML